MDQVPIDDKSGSGSNVPMSVNKDRASSTAIHNSTQSVVTLLLLLLILLAFGLRVFALERQSMWSDEGLSYYRATLPAAEVLKGLIVIDGVETRDTNPPLYFLLLHFWESLGGETIFSLRLSGVLAGTLAVPLIFVLGSAIYGRWVGLAAALFMAISPFHIWQSQVLRNYSLLLTLNLASVYGLFRYALSTRRQHITRWLVLWFLAGLLGIYTHYFGFFVFAFGAFTLFILLAWRWNLSRLLRQKWFWIVTVLGLLILVPAVALGLNRFRAGQQFDFFHIGLTQVLVHAAGAFGVGVEPTLSHSWWRYLSALLLAGAGLLIGWRRRRLPTVVLLGYQLIPLGLMLLLSLVNPLYNGVRHLLIGLPPFLLFAANGAAGIPELTPRTSGRKRWSSFLQGLLLLLFAVVVLIQVEWLYRQFNDEELLRDDVRGAAEYLNEAAEAGDLIVLHDTIIGFTFDYYYDGAAEWRAVPALYEQDLAAAKAAIVKAGEDADRIWFLARPTPRTGFPRKDLWDWIDTTWPRFFDQEFPSMWLRVQLVGYKPHPVSEAMPSSATAVNKTFGNVLRLHGVELPVTLKAGEPRWMTLYWSKLDVDAQDYNLSLRLVDEQGQQWWQDDELLWHAYPPNQWPENRIISHDLAMTLASGIPPGGYEVWLRVTDGERRPYPLANGAFDLSLGHIDLLAGTEIAGLPPISEQYARLEDIDLLGYKLPEDQIRPGHALPIDLYWRVRQTPLGEFLLRLELIDQNGAVISAAEGALTRADYPVSTWQAGELLQSKMQMTVPASADETPHSLRASLIAPATGESIAAVTLQDKIVVDPWPFVGDLPPDLDLVRAEFGESGEILLPGTKTVPTTLNPGDLLNLTLYWQAQRDIGAAYYVFVHLIAEDGSIAAQVDSAPVRGFRPTESWREGEVIEDTYAVPVTADVRPGNYRLMVGLYHPDTWERPLTKVDDQVVPDRSVYLGDIAVGQRE